MKPNEMHNMCHRGCHENGPRGWHDVPVMSGDYDLDATIMHRKNKDMPKRLNLYVRRSTGYNTENIGTRKLSGTYGPRSNHDGYLGYHGDE